VTDRAPVYPRVLDELVPAARHVSEQYANKRDRGRPRPAQSPATADARPQTRRVRADHLCRSCFRAESAPGHCAITADVLVHDRVRTAFDQLALAL
jgi:hypothetical protein